MSGRVRRVRPGPRKSLKITDGHEAEAKRELADANPGRIGRVIREIFGWPVATRRTKSVSSVNRAPQGQSHMHSRPHDGA
jgi:hypothetical protein